MLKIQTAKIIKTKLNRKMDKNKDKMSREKKSSRQNKRKMTKYKQKIK